MNGFKPNLAGRNYVSKGTHRKIWAPIACVETFFVCLYVTSPFDPLQTEKTADFGVESHDSVYLGLMTEHKFCGSSCSEVTYEFAGDFLTTCHTRVL